MEKATVFDYLKIGDTIPELEKTAELEEYKIPELFGLVEVSQDHAKIKAQAKTLGIDAIHTSMIFPGPIMLQFISEMITNWLPDIRCWVEGGRLIADFKRPVHFQEKLVCRGRIKDKIMEEGQRYIICDVWIENAQGEFVIAGEAHICC